MRLPPDPRALAALITFKGRPVTADAVILLNALWAVLGRGDASPAALARRLEQAGIAVVRPVRARTRLGDRS